MTDKQYYTIFSDAASSTGNLDCSAFVSDWATSSIWGDTIEAPIPQGRIDAIKAVWNDAHITIRDIRAKTGLTQAAFAVHFCIPKRTIEAWETGDRKCPPYVRLLLARAVWLAKENNNG